MEVRKEKPAFRDTPRGRRCKDFTDEAGYLRCEWARLRLALLRDSKEKRKQTMRPGTTRGTAARDREGHRRCGRKTGERHERVHGAAGTDA